MRISWKSDQGRVQSSMLHHPHAHIHVCSHLYTHVPKTLTYIHTYMNTAHIYMKNYSATEYAQTFSLPLFPK